MISTLYRISCFYVIPMKYVVSNAVGKTTLVHKLSTDTFGKFNMTDGITINEWEHEGVRFHLWDYGGQVSVEWHKCYIG